MELSQFLLQSDIRELEDEIKLIEGSVRQIESGELDCELSELLSTKVFNIESEEGAKFIKYTKDLSTNRGKRKAELDGKFTLKSCILNGSLRIRGRDLSDGSIFFDWMQKFEHLETEDASKEKIAAAFKHAEEELYKKFSEYNIAVSEKVVKHLRRQLPVTKTKLDWERYALQPRIPEKRAL